MTRRRWVVLLAVLMGLRTLWGVVFADTWYDRGILFTAVAFGIVLGLLFAWPHRAPDKDAPTQGVRDRDATTDERAD